MSMFHNHYYQSAHDGVACIGRCPRSIRDCFFERDNHSSVSESEDAVSVSRQRYREGQKGGGKGGARPHEETIHGKQSPSPLTSVCLPRPQAISLSNSMRDSRMSPQVTPSETAFGGSPKLVFQGAIFARFCFLGRSPPALPSACS